MDKIRVKWTHCPNGCGCAVVPLGNGFFVSTDREGNALDVEHKCEKRGIRK